MFEIQAHSLPIERIRVSHDNNHLFSVGQDGMFGIFQILDKDPKTKDKEFNQVIQSEEILIEKSEQDKKKAEIEHLNNQIEIDRQKKEATQQQDLDRKNKKISDLTQEIDNKAIENQQRYDQLHESKKEMENMYKEKQHSMAQAHQDEMERRKQDYADKMEADQMRFDELQQSKDEDTRKFEERLHELTLYHEKITNELEQDQQIDLNRQTQETNMLKETMEQLMKNHSQLREKIENDAWEEIDVLRDKNKEELAKHIDAGMDSKCSLTMINNDYRLKKQAKEEE